jgi:hypothetical protein
LDFWKGIIPWVRCLNSIFWICNHTTMLWFCSTCFASYVNLCFNKKIGCTWILAKLCKCVGLCCLWISFWIQKTWILNFVQLKKLGCYLHRVLVLLNWEFFFDIMWHVTWCHAPCRKACGCLGYTYGLWQNDCQLNNTQVASFLIQVFCVSNIKMMHF